MAWAVIIKSTYSELSNAAIGGRSTFWMVRH